MEIVGLQTTDKRKRRAPPAVPPAIRNVRRELQTASQQGRPQVVHVLLLDLTSFSKMPFIIEDNKGCWFCGLQLPLVSFSQVPRRVSGAGLRPAEAGDAKGDVHTCWPDVWTPLCAVPDSHTSSPQPTTNMDSSCKRRLQGSCPSSH